MRCRTCRAVDSKAALAMFPREVEGERPTMVPRASERQRGANSPVKAGTMATPPLEGVASANSLISSAVA